MREALGNPKSQVARPVWFPAREAFAPMLLVLFGLACVPITPVFPDAGRDAGGGGPEAQAGGSAVGGGSAGSTVGGGSAGSTVGGGTAPGGGLAIGGGLPFAGGNAIAGGSVFAGGAALGGGGALGGGSPLGGGATVAGGAGGGSLTGGGDAGGSAGGAAAPFTWTPWSVPAGVSLQAISGQPGALYAVSFDGRLLRATTTSFTAVIGLTVADASDVVATPSGRVVVSGSVSSWLCESGCDLAGSYQPRTPPMLGERFSSLCVRGEAVYAITQGTSASFLNRLDGGLWVREPIAPVGNAMECVVQPDGAVLVVGTNGVAEGTTAQSITSLPPDPAWRALALGALDGGVGDALIVGSASGGGRSALRASGSSTWTQLAPETRVIDLTRVAAFGADEFVALVEPRPGQPSLFHFQNGTWSPLTGAPSMSLVQLITNVNGALFLGGIASGQGVLYRGTRP